MSKKLRVTLVLIGVALLAVFFVVPALANNGDDDYDAWDDMREACVTGNWDKMREAMQELGNYPGYWGGMMGGWGHMGGGGMMRWR